MAIDLSKQEMVQQDESLHQETEDKHLAMAFKASMNEIAQPTHTATPGEPLPNEKWVMTKEDKAKLSRIFTTEAVASTDEVRQLLRDLR